MISTVVNILVGLGLVGAAVLALGHAQAAQAIWLVANAGLAAHNWLIGQRAQAALFAGYLVVAAVGVWRWA